MKVYTVSVDDGPQIPISEMTTQMLHEMIADRANIQTGDPLSIDAFIEQARLILSLREQGAPI